MFISCHADGRTEASAPQIGPPRPTALPRLTAPINEEVATCPPERTDLSRARSVTSGDQIRAQARGDPSPMHGITPQRSDSGSGLLRLTTFRETTAQKSPVETGLETIDSVCKKRFTQCRKPLSALRPCQSFPK